MFGEPFQIVRVNDSAGAREMARFKCGVCEAHADLPLVRTRASYNPEATVRRAYAEGWSISGNRVRCARCTAARAISAKGESPGPKVVPHTAKVVPLKTPVPAAEQRLAIRALLEKHFDEGIGRYVGGYSDQRVAEECKVPRVMVESIRDAAYGPIQTPPELQAAEDKLASLMVTIAEAKKLGATLVGAAEDVERMVATARKALGLAA